MSDPRTAPDRPDTPSGRTPRVSHVTGAGGEGAVMSKYTMREAAHVRRQLIDAMVDNIHSACLELLEDGDPLVSMLQRFVEKRNDKPGGGSHDSRDFRPLAERLVDELLSDSLVHLDAGPEMTMPAALLTGGES